MNDSQCGETLGEHTCSRHVEHSGKHQAVVHEEDNHYDLQIIEWWSIKPNGDPVEEQ